MAMEWPLELVSKRTQTRNGESLTNKLIRSHNSIPRDRNCISCVSRTRRAPPGEKTLLGLTSWCMICWVSCSSEARESSLDPSRGHDSDLTYFDRLVSTELTRGVDNCGDTTRVK